LSVRPVGLADGKNGHPYLELKDFNGGLYGTQLVCAAGSVVYAVGGRGAQPADPSDNNSFRKGQTWHLLAVDVDARRKLWEVPLPTRPAGSERLHFLSGRVAGGRLVLVRQAADGTTDLVVRDARTGRLLWSRPLDSRQPVLSRAHLAVDDRHVYPSAGRFVALGLDDGKVAWRYDKGGAGAEYSPPAVKDGVVYAVRAGHGVVAVDARSGAERWAEKTAKTNGATTADLGIPPVVGIAYVYRGTPRGLTAVGLSDGSPAGLVKAPAGALYFAHESARRIIALGAQYAAGYPLL